MNEDQTPALEAGDDTALSDEPTIVEEGQETEEEETSEGSDEASHEPPVEDSSEDEPGDREPDEERTNRNRERKERRKEMRERGMKAVESLKAIKESAQAGVAPKAEDFDDHLEYVAAKSVYDYSQQAVQRDITKAEAELSEIEEQTRAARQEAYQQSVVEARPKYTDFDAVVNNPNATISPQLADLIMDSDSPADLAYAVAKNPMQSRYLSSLSPVEQARELGRLEASLAASAPKRQTRTPPPPKTETGRAAHTPDPNKMSFAEYKRWREGG